MFGLDQWIAGLNNGGSPLIVLAIALLLGLRHASDPDHLVAVSSLVATEERAGRRAARLGLAWGAGHATTLAAFGIPIVIAGSYLPGTLQRVAEALVGITIVALALQLLRKWRRGGFHVHEHEHGGVIHRHLHQHGTSPLHAHDHPMPRTAAQSFAVGLLHGVGGSAGVGLLLLASIHDRVEALAALLLFASATAASMAILSLGAGLVLARAPIAKAVPGLGAMALGFGVLYALGAVVQ